MTDKQQPFKMPEPQGHDEMTDKMHRPGCDALGGYGNGVGACTCTAAPSPGMPSDALRHAGAMLSNCAFNLAQRRPGEPLTEADIRALDESRKAWDAALRSPADQGEKDAEIGRAWRENSSLEKWFPLTAEEMKDLRKDAERYRWLRERNAILDGDSGIFTAIRTTFQSGEFAGNDLIAGDEMDAAIDAAMSPLTPDQIAGSDSTMGEM